MKADTGKFALKGGGGEGRSLKAESGKYALKGGTARMIVGRNATTGRYVLAPASKISKTSLTQKTKVVESVKRGDESKGKSSVFETMKRASRRSPSDRGDR